MSKQLSAGEILDALEEDDDTEAMEQALNAVTTLLADRLARQLNITYDTAKFGECVFYKTAETKPGALEDYDTEDELEVDPNGPVCDETWNELSDAAKKMLTNEAARFKLPVRNFTEAAVQEVLQHEDMLDIFSACPKGWNGWPDEITPEALLEIL